MNKETQITTESDPTIENNQLLRKLVRQLKFLNFMIVFFGVISVLGAIAFGIVILKGAEMLANSKDQITNLISPTSTSGNSEDLQKQLCEGNSVISNYIKSNSEVCNETKN